MPRSSATRLKQKVARRPVQLTARRRMMELSRGYDFGARFTGRIIKPVVDTRTSSSAG
jgi:hypothetical protein